MAERKIITNKVVLPETGKTMEQWFEVMDKKGAAEMTQENIFLLTGKIKGLSNLSEWNRNLVTTSYTWHKGLRQRGEKEGGFEISVSKTVNVPLNELYSSFSNDAQRKKWLKEKILIRKQTENKSARVTWSDGITSLSIDFYAKGKDKSQIVVQHMKIADAKKADEMKFFWGEKLAVMKELLEA